MAPVAVLLGVLGVAGILLGLFLLAVASFADGSTGERVVTIAIAVGFVASAVSCCGSPGPARSGAVPERSGEPARAMQPLRRRERAA